MMDNITNGVADTTTTKAAEPQTQGQREKVAYEAWGYYRHWAALARSLKSSRKMLRWVVLVLALASIVLGPSAKYLAKPGAPAWLPPVVTWLSALLVVVVAWFNKEIVGPGEEKRWIQCRELAEWFKGEVYRFLTDALPYGGQEPSLLVAKMEEKLKAAPRLPLPELTEAQLRDGYPGYPLSIEQFIKKRLDDQVHFFKRGADENWKQARIYRNAGLLFSGLVLVLGVPVPLYFNNGITGWLKDTAQLWVPVINATAALLVTYSSQRRYQFLADEYEGARRDLELQRLRWQASAQGDAERKQLVTVCEEIMSRQNAAWAKEMARD